MLYRAITNHSSALLFVIGRDHRHLRRFALEAADVIFGRRQSQNWLTETGGTVIAWPPPKMDFFPCGGGRIRFGTFCTAIMLIHAVGLNDDFSFDLARVCRGATGRASSAVWNQAENP